jgi:hypothetical protein
MYQLDRESLVVMQKNQEKIIINATDKVFNTIIKHKNLNVLPDFMKTSNFIEQTKQARQKSSFGYQPLPSGLKTSEMANFSKDLGKKMVKNKLNRAIA